MSWMHHLRMAAPRASTDLLKGFACVCLFWGFYVSVYGCLSRTSFVCWQAKVNVLRMCVCSSHIDIFCWETKYYLLMKVGWGNLGILKE